VTLAELNALDRDGFVRAVGWVFEHSPWVAERTWPKQPFGTTEELHAVMVAQVDAASPEERLALLQAHPDLGTRARISPASTGEQAGASLDRLTPEEFDNLQRLNTAYRAKFGFPFLFAVKGATKHDILQALERRLQEPPEAEYREAFRQVSRIAEFRLKELLSRS
jgi:2-oxo-4-hydroxy-4-carboxy-5-ureidoimidazoline decarboxylase